MQKRFVCLAIFLLVFTASIKKSHCYPPDFGDSGGRDISIIKKDASVFVGPFLFEILCLIGAGYKLKGPACHFRYPPDTERGSRLENFS